MSLKAWACPPAGGRVGLSCCAPSQPAAVSAPSGFNPLTPPRPDRRCAHPLAGGVGRRPQVTSAGWTFARESHAPGWPASWPGRAVACPG